MVKAIFIPFIVFFIFLIGCSDDIKSISVPVYQVYADNSFTDNHKIDIAAALEEWNAKTNNIMQYQLHFVDYKNLKKSTQDAQVIYIFSSEPGTGLLGFTVWDDNKNGAYILIKPGIKRDDIFTAVALHEIGHALHLGHFNEPYLSIMHPMINTDTLHLECTDIRAFCEKWNCELDCAYIYDKKFIDNIKNNDTETNVCKLRQNKNIFDLLDTGL